MEQIKKKSLCCDRILCVLRVYLIGINLLVEETTAALTAQNVLNANLDNSRVSGLKVCAGYLWFCGSADVFGMG